MIEKLYEHELKEIIKGLIYSHFEMDVAGGTNDDEELVDLIIKICKLNLK